MELLAFLGLKSVFCKVALCKALGILEIVSIELKYAQCGFCASYAKLKVGLLWAILVTKT